MTRVNLGTLNKGDVTLLRYFKEEGGQTGTDGQYSQPRLKMAINPVEYYETDQIKRITQTSL